mmetsp:Transcript_52689/g.150295  ORF Transcript_52689/g.150295 Transcript_52689/m.150295 type:complete len:217 (-) Transcript_52689:1-651(-)
MDPRAQGSKTSQPNPSGEIQQYTSSHMLALALHVCFHSTRRHTRCSRPHFCKGGRLLRGTPGAWAARAPARRAPPPSGPARPRAPSRGNRCRRPPWTSCSAPKARQNGLRPSISPESSPAWTQLRPRPGSCPRLPEAVFRAGKALACAHQHRLSGSPGGSWVSLGTPGALRPGRGRRRLRVRSPTCARRVLWCPGRAAARTGRLRRRSKDGWGIRA